MHLHLHLRRHGNTVKAPQVKPCLLQLGRTCSVGPSSSARSMEPSEFANSGLRNLASKKALSSARMNLRRRHRTLDRADDA